MTTVAQEEVQAPLLAELVLQHPKAQVPIGTKLPTERELEHELGLSRHSLRRALALLEQEGWISRQVGRGTFLIRSAADYRAGDFATRWTPLATTQIRGTRSGRAPKGRSGSRQLADVAPADVLVARHVIEPNAMKFVVARATTRDFETLHDCIVGGDNATTFEEFEYWDLHLHRAIITASHNPLLIRIYEAIEEARHSPIWGELKRGSSTLERRSSYRCDHHAIVDALVTRNALAATEAMQLHLTRIEQDLFGATGFSRHVEPERPPEV